MAETYSAWYWILLGLAIFCLKTLALVFLVIQLRWTLPRLRVDQMMSMCWKYLIPIAFVCILGTMTWIVFVGQDTMLEKAIRIVLFAAGAGIAVRQLARTAFNYRADSANYTKLTGQPLWYPPFRLP